MIDQCNRALDVTLFVLYELIPAVLASDWVDGAELIKSACAPLGSLYGQHTDDPQALYPEWRVVCSDPLVDAGAAIGGQCNMLGYGKSGMATAEEFADQIDGFWNDTLAVLDMCRDRAPDVTASVLLEWS